MTQPTRQLRALELLAAAGPDGLTGSDAVTALDIFLERTARHVARLVDGMSPQERHAFLTARYGSDAVRVAQVLIRDQETQP